MLQGTLDDFALDEVLVLLSTTSKTGKLEMRGDRGTGSVALNHGQLVEVLASRSTSTTSIDDVLFELLRFRDGSFVFTTTDREVGDITLDTEQALAAAGGRLADWRAVQAVVPSVRHIVTPTPDLPADEVTIDRKEWAALNIIGRGCPVGRFCDESGLGEVDGSRRLRALADRALVRISAPPQRVAERTAAPDDARQQQGGPEQAQPAANPVSQERQPAAAAQATPQPATPDPTGEVASAPAAADPPPRPPAQRRILSDPAPAPAAPPASGPAGAAVAAATGATPAAQPAAAWPPAQPNPQAAARQQAQPAARPPAGEGAPSRPPMPAPPTAEELAEASRAAGRQAEDTQPGGPPPAEEVENGDLGEDPHEEDLAGSGRLEARRPTGLLMRHLRSDN